MMTRPVPDYYAVLNVSRGASPQEIARAYRALMRRHHPDVAGGEAAPAELQLIMQAFSVLRDPKRRHAYDREASRAGPADPPAEHNRPRKPSEANGQDARQSAEGRDDSSPQDIPVRVVRRREPPLRATPVRWESGPWA
ncbi:DnaJ-class molecular chaperone [Arthrobacter globiformis]|jgi:DnaJ-class molecular chaperone|uniref:J domain-containing protein n=1 Tax=Arthrobacter globiformis TaxID=1665 RepID=UPI00278B078C|nr:DnaJ domain-containing protein [Arthrobacter globiformis]MDQ1058606.1 DnaJ-class molecular chaperone [Arthrobacter globiformis]